MIRRSHFLKKTIKFIGHLLVPMINLTVNISFPKNLERLTLLGKISQHLTVNSYLWTEYRFCFLNSCTPLFFFLLLSASKIEGGWEGTTNIPRRTDHIPTVIYSYWWYTRFKQRFLKAPIFPPPGRKLTLWLHLVWPAPSYRGGPHFTIHFPGNMGRNFISQRTVQLSGIL